MMGNDSMQTGQPQKVAKVAKKKGSFSQGEGAIVG
jgi:hypothetical protein